MSIYGIEFTGFIYTSLLILLLISFKKVKDAFIKSFKEDSLGKI
jgi:hypothetical protein